MQSTRRGSFSVHRSEKTPGSKYSSTSGLSPRGHLERQAEFHASTPVFILIRILGLRSCQGFQIVVQDMHVRNRVGGSRVFDEQVVDFQVLAFVETNPEIRLGQGAKIVADVGVLARHVDKYVAERQFLDELMLVGFQHIHEAEILGRDFAVEVALQDGVRHLVAKDDEPAPTDTEKAFYAAFDILVNALVVLVKNDENGVNSLKIRHFCSRFLAEKLLQSLVECPISEV